jgi:hypothetical protein
MIYTVVWLQLAEQELADVWLRASDRRAVTQAANRIERGLRRDAHLQGQQSGPERVVVDDPPKSDVHCEPGRLSCYDHLGGRKLTQVCCLTGENTLRCFR